MLYLNNLELPAWLSQRMPEAKRLYDENLGYVQVGDVVMADWPGDVYSYLAVVSRIIPGDKRPSYRVNFLNKALGKNFLIKNETDLTSVDIEPGAMVYRFDLQKALGQVKNKKLDPFIVSKSDNLLEKDFVKVEGGEPIPWENIAVWRN